MKPRMNADRSFWKFLILSTVTFGIGGLFYMHRIAKDVNIMCEEDGKHSPGVLACILLTLLTCGIYRMLWWCNMHDRMRAAAKHFDTTIDQTTSGLMLLFIGGYFLWGIFDLIAIYKFNNSINELSVAYNHHNGHAA